ncbi:uncharacterized protein FOMMEDRAFT_111633 [Fomitiporia mediterranea MF3/22]|uniref:uncharacterized protein n=1 Tax=Fomitiporia mediterranea (strain MF3/22) TaxID=694068 RepID=UPI0004408BED|nr:uncharacterized protein FOMMEDRAFT_111633 [Fomitiporia mediterranea MF3/22]EJD01650.1 hypothetical protein FOMMEDRAFT_111633 [Fomitiporia mediterranea MF3/22]
MDDVLALGFNDISSEWDKAMNVDDKLPGLDFDLSGSSTESSKSDRGFSPSAVLTPPDSQMGSPVDNNSERGTCISVSTTFYPQSEGDDANVLIILASDSVFFYVNSNLLISASRNGFNSHLPIARENDSDPILSLPETSAVLNILLHTIYDMSCAHYYPSLADLSAAVTACKTYGIPLKKYIAAGTPLSQALLAYAPTNPLEVYALAASHDLLDLAVTTSSHLLSFQLPTLTDEMAVRIGPVYLKKLFFLHLGRIDALKRLLVVSPPPHAPTQTCDFTEQKAITRAWSLATAYLTWSVRPDLSASTIEATLHPLADHLTCDQCRSTLLARIREVVVQWSMVKRTI